MSNDRDLRPSGFTAVRRASALILAGAAGKGPYAAGALATLARDPRFDVRSVIGASSGALNAAVYAAGLRVGEESAAAELLCELWRERAHWSRVLTHGDRVRVVEEGLAAFRDKTPRQEVTLDIVLASLRGERNKPSEHRRYEYVARFGSADFSSRERTRSIAEACVASAALPVIFRPRNLGDKGPFWDGGIVNNAPIGLALRRDPRVDHMIVVTPDADEVDDQRYFPQLSLERLLDMLINERLARDLHAAKTFNEELFELDAATRETLRRKHGWKLLELVEIRPQTALRGNAASGFASREYREEYLAIGRTAAQVALERWVPRYEGATLAAAAHS